MKHVNASKTTKKSMPMFSTVTRNWAIAIAAGAVLSVGGYLGVESSRANAEEADLVSAQSLVKGAANIASRELAVLKMRESSTKAAIDDLESVQEEMEFLVGKGVHELEGQRQGMVNAARSRIEAAARIDKATSLALELRAAKGSNSDFIEAAKTALGGLTIEQLKARGKFEGPEGFASQNLATLESSVVADKAEAIRRRGELRARIAEWAPDFDEAKSDAIVQQRAKESGEQALRIAQSEAEHQIEQYRTQVRQAAESAFRRQGEIMGESDWSEINRDLERDRDWQNAKSGLVAAAHASAKTARELSTESWDDERDHAHELAAAIALDRSNIERMRVWEMAMLMQWMAPSHQTVVIVSAPQTRMASQGYSLTGAPRSGLDGASAMKIAQGAIVAPAATHFNSSNFSVAMSHGLAVRNGDEQAAAKLASKAATARAALQTASKIAPTNDKSGAFAQSSAYGSKEWGPKPDIASAPNFAWNNAAGIAAQRARSSSGVNSASEMASAKNSDKASDKAADTAVGVALAAAAVKAAGSAVSKTAWEGAAKASQTAAGNAVSRVAQSSAVKAADGAAAKAADGAAAKAADGAAAKAAQGAAAKAAQGVAAKAAQGAAAKAAQSAAAKAAQSAAAKATQSATTKATQSATTKAAATSTSSGRR